MKEIKNMFAALLFTITVICAIYFIQWKYKTSYRSYADTIAIVDSLTKVVKELDRQDGADRKRNNTSLKMAFQAGYSKGGQLIMDNKNISDKDIDIRSSKDFADFGKKVDSIFK